MLFNIESPTPKLLSDAEKIERAKNFTENGVLRDSINASISVNSEDITMPPYDTQDYSSRVVTHKKESVMIEATPEEAPLVLEGPASKVVTLSAQEIEEMPLALKKLYVKESKADLSHITANGSLI
jgi:hypothetical protein